MNPSDSFDRYADDYESALSRGLSVSGEDRDYFARGRVVWLARRLRELGRPVSSVLDFGCGTGDTAPHLLGELGADHVTGVDTSRPCLETAVRKFGSERVRFVPADEFRPAGDHDLVFCNGVFHHIPPPARAERVRWIWECLRPGGLFAFWENNPWNPGTRLVMWRIPFDRGAVKVSPPEARRLLSDGGFQVLLTDFQFVFPRALRSLRGLESGLARLPLGAQYMVLARKPG